MKRLTVGYLRHLSGATAIEYALLAAVFSLAIFAGSGSITSALKAQFGVLNGALETATGQTPEGEKGISEKQIVVEGIRR